MHCIKELYKILVCYTLQQNANLLVKILNNSSKPFFSSYVN